MYSNWTRALTAAAIIGLLLTAAVIVRSMALASQHELVFTTGSDVGLYHEIGQHFSTVVEDNLSDVQLMVASSAGSRQNIERLEAGEADIAIVQNDSQGNGTIRSLAALYPEVLHLVCRKEKQVRTLRDLEPLRTNLGVSGSGTQQVSTKLLKFSGVDLSTATVHEESFDTAKKLLDTGELDAAFFLVGIGAAMVDQLLSNHELELVPISVTDDATGDVADPTRQLVDGLRVEYPYVEYIEIPMMAYSGRPKRPIPSLGVQAVLVCRRDLDDSLASTLTATLFEQRAVLGRKTFVLSRLEEDVARRGLQFPIHSGAEQFYHRKDPGFLAQNAESLGLIVTLLLLAGSALHALHRWLTQSQKNHVDTYYARLQTIITRAGRCNSTDEITNLENELLAIENEACRELIDEQLNADDSFLIFQNMSRACHSSLEVSRRQLDG